MIMKLKFNLSYLDRTLLLQKLLIGSRIMRHRVCNPNDNFMLCLTTQVRVNKRFVLVSRKEVMEKLLNYHISAHLLRNN